MTAAVVVPSLPAAARQEDRARVRAVLGRGPQVHTCEPVRVQDVAAELSRSAHVGLEVSRRGPRRACEKCEALLENVLVAKHERVDELEHDRDPDAQQEPGEERDREAQLRPGPGRHGGRHRDARDLERRIAGPDEASERAEAIGERASLADIARLLRKRVEPAGETADDLAELLLEDPVRSRITPVANAFAIAAARSGELPSPVIVTMLLCCCGATRTAP